MLLYFKDTILCSVSCDFHIVATKLARLSYTERRSSRICMSSSLSFFHNENLCCSVFFKQRDRASMALSEKSSPDYTFRGSYSYTRLWQMRRNSRALRWHDSDPVSFNKICSLVYIGFILISMQRSIDWDNNGPTELLYHFLVEIKSGVFDGIQIISNLTPVFK